MANETRLIDANSIKYRSHTVCGGHGLYYDEKIVYAQDIDKMPTVDAVEIVRCKNCENRYINKHGEPCCEIWAHNHDTVVRDYDFCSYGKRKTNG